jgi:hypothetical protein
MLFEGRLPGRLKRNTLPPVPCGFQHRTSFLVSGRSREQERVDVVK